MWYVRATVGPSLSMYPLQPSPPLSPSHSHCPLPLSHCHCHCPLPLSICLHSVHLPLSICLHFVHLPLSTAIVPLPLSTATPIVHSLCHPTLQRFGGRGRKWESMKVNESEMLRRSCEEAFLSACFDPDSLNPIFDCTDTRPHTFTKICAQDLWTLCPDVVVMYEPDLPFLRQV